MSMLLRRLKASMYYYTSCRGHTRADKPVTGSYYSILNRRRIENLYYKKGADGKFISWPHQLNLSGVRCSAYRVGTCPFFFYIHNRIASSAHL